MTTYVLCTVVNLRVYCHILLLILRERTGVMIRGIVSSYTRVAGKQLHMLVPTNLTCSFLHEYKKVHM